jgi:hypothetical protein
MSVQALAPGTFDIGLHSDKDVKGFTLSPLLWCETQIITNYVDKSHFFPLPTCLSQRYHAQFIISAGYVHRGTRTPQKYMQNKNKQVSRTL